MNNFRQEMNSLGRDRRPFIFIIDFEMERPLIFPLDELPGGYLFDTPLKRNFDPPASVSSLREFTKSPVSYKRYLEAYEIVAANIRHGNSYLVNLTFPTQVETGMSLEEIFHSSRARYRLLIAGQFVVFSPETFVRISGNNISTYPMKGTINGDMPGAERTILADVKEKSEHDTIVDLLRNDLSMVSNNVEVKRYRYIDRIMTGGSSLLQVSSEICGEVADGWNERSGDIIWTLLPAGSVSGAPKKETVRIIQESERDSRGYYTGVFGIYDGVSLDSAVMIRYIEQKGSGYVYRSGGGITYLSDPVKEYNELISKVYVPVG